MKGIILAGGSGSRLYPVTAGISKQLIPLHDKPMVYYPLSILMQAGIREILIISTPRDLPGFERLLGDGKSLGCRFAYAAQASPDGLARAFVIGRDFVGNDKVALILGDNLFHGPGFGEWIRQFTDPRGAVVFATRVADPQRGGVVNFDAAGEAVSLEEKPPAPKSNFAVPGLYFYDNSVVQIAAETKPSARGEYEITSVNQAYLQRQQLQVNVLDPGVAWFDAGTFESLAAASTFVRETERQQGTKIGCIEEVAFREQLIDGDQLAALAKRTGTGEYGHYLAGIAERGHPAPAAPPKTPKFAE